MKKYITLLLSLAMLLTSVLSPIGTLDVHADAGVQLDLSVNDIGIEEFSISYWDAVSETAVRPTTRNMDALSLGALAAAELQKWIADATGTTLPLNVVDKNSAAAEKTIQLVFDSSLNRDGFSIKVEGSNVTIAGGKGAGLWYGVYEFLEEGLGYHFLTDTITKIHLDGLNPEYAERTDNIVNIVNCSWQEAPGFEYRNTVSPTYVDLANANGYDDVTGTFIGQWDYDGIRANIAHKLNGSDDSKWALNYPQWGDGLGTRMSHAHAFEYFLSGTGLSGGTWDTQPCLTDEATYEAMVAGVAALAAKWVVPGEAFPVPLIMGEHKTQLSIGWNDNENYCQCANCQAKIEELGSLTDVYIDYINRIAEDIDFAETYPGLTLMALAYNVCTEPPKNVMPADHVSVLYCSNACNNHTLQDALDGNTDCIGAAYLRDASQKQELRKLQAWTEMCDEVYVWLYMDNFASYLTPAAFYNYTYEEISVLADLGVEGIYAEMGINSGMPGDVRYGFQELRDYLVAQMMWNPDMTWEEYESLTKEFISLFYCDNTSAEATELIYTYLQMWDAAGTTENESCWLNNYSSPKAANDLEHYRENGAEMLDLLERAQALVAAAKGEDSTEVLYIRRLGITCRFLTLSGEYTTRYTNGSESERAEYKQDYANLYADACEVLPVMWLDYFMDYLHQYYDEDKEALRNPDNLTTSNTIYTTADGVVIDYCPMAWYGGRDGFFDVDPNYYTVEFYAEEGDLFATQRIGNFYAAQLPEEPQKVGYIFEGWSYVDASGANQTFKFGFPSGTKITGANTTDGVFPVYAVWSEDPNYVPEYSVTFDANGGSVDVSNMTTNGQVLASLPTATREGYDFTGWYTEATGGTQVTTSTVFSADTTVYAQYVAKEYKVTFNANGGSTDANDMTTSGQVLASLPTATREGYTFTGWYTEATGGTQVTTATVFAADATVYAQWKENVVVENKPQEHTHAYRSLKNDDTYHWTECDCGEIGAKGTHNYAESATAGMKRCVDCGYETAGAAGTTTTGTTSVQTGDSSNLILWAALSVVAAGAAAVYVFLNKKINFK